MRKKSRIFAGQVPILLGMVAALTLMMFPIGVGSADGRSGAGSRDDIALRILYSGGLKGNIEPCG